MVAYNFRPSFAARILCGQKRQTIREPRGGRGRHARLGDPLQLYTGMRTKACRKLGDATCAEVREAVLDFARYRVVLDDAIELATEAELRDFAISDGFAVPERWGGGARAVELHAPLVGVDPPRPRRVPGRADSLGRELSEHANPMTDMLPPPCPHAIRALDLTLAAARRQELAQAARSETARFRHELAAVALRWQAETAAGLIKGGGDG